MRALTYGHPKDRANPLLGCFHPRDRHRPPPLWPVTPVGAARTPQVDALHTDNLFSPTPR